MRKIRTDRISFIKIIFLSLFITLSACSSAEFFHISPVRPVDELIAEALTASPPVETGEFRQAELVELIKLDSTIRLDIGYATNNNFLSTPLYSQARAFLQRPAAEAVVRVNKKLLLKGYGLLIHDAYRPWYITKVFWDATPVDLHNFVADPSKGSKHNRGCAVDLTLFDLKTGKPVVMPSLYDEMSERAYANYSGGTDEQRKLRDLLRTEMESEGFTVYEFEWWHFDYKDWKSYTVQNVRFEEIP
ncbi:MAG: M15 family metallopeptidase [Ignavibacteriales bacterium]|nr:M15 family metallopeptidase [Ignavibacteriales bacterium]